MDLHARSGRLGQAPLAAAAPLAIVDVRRSDRRAHHRHLADARFKRPSAGHVDRDRQIHQRDRGQHHRHLADADSAADTAILWRYHQILHRDWFRHSATIRLLARQSILYVHLFILRKRKRNCCSLNKHPIYIRLNRSEETRR